MVGWSTQGEFALVFARFELYLIISARLLVNGHRSFVSSLPTRRCQTKRWTEWCVFDLIPLISVEWYSTMETPSIYYKGA